MTEQDKKRLYSKKYYESNKQIMLERAKQYYKENKNDLIDKTRKYYKEKQEVILDKKKVYYQNNKEEILEKVKKYGIENKEKISILKKEYGKNNKKKIREYKNRYHKERLETDTLYKLYHTTRHRIKSTIKNNNYTKKSKTHEIVGCTFEELKTYFESKFESWMNWNNHGLYNGQINYGWDIDHIIPISSAKTEEELFKLFHYTNLQPLCSYTNRYIKKCHT